MQVQVQVLRLIVFEMTPVKGGFWCLGYDRGDNLHRLVPEEGSMVWLESPNMLQVGYTYDFTISVNQERAKFSQEIVVLNEYKATDVPYNNDTLLGVKHLAQPTIDGIFNGLVKENRYINVNPSCPAFGIWEFIKGDDEIPKITNFRYGEDHKKRIIIGGYNLPYKPTDNELPEDRVWYVILGLSNSFSGTMPRNYSPMRCYLMVLGIRGSRTRPMFGRTEGRQ